MTTVLRSPPVWSEAELEDARLEAVGCPCRPIRLSSRGQTISRRMDSVSAKPLVERLANSRHRVLPMRLDFHPRRKYHEIRGIICMCRLCASAQLR